MREGDALRRTVAEHEASAKSLAVEVAARMDSVHAETERLRAELAVLEGTRAELADMHQLYERMQASTSWRVTRPLRRLASVKSERGTGSGS